MPCLSCHALMCASCVAALSHVGHRRMVQVGEDIALVEHEASLPRIDRPELSRHHERPLQVRCKQQESGAWARKDAADA